MVTRMNSDYCTTSWHEEAGNRNLDTLNWLIDKYNMEDDLYEKGNYMGKIVALMWTMGIDKKYLVFKENDEL